MEDEEGRKLEPYEEATVECPTEFTGACVDLLGSRAGQMLDMQANDVAGTTTIKYRVPTRGLIGLRSAMLTASKGNAVLNTIFDGYGEWSGDLNTRANGSLVAHETGQTTQYALKDIQERGTLFMGQGEKIYKGQVIGIHQRFGDLVVNAAKAKKALPAPHIPHRTPHFFTPLRIAAHFFRCKKLIVVPSPAPR